MKADVSRTSKKRLKISPFWAKQLHFWHWTSSAICLAGMLLFAATGITLNHAASIESEPQTVSQSADLPDNVVRELTAVAETGEGPLPESARQWAHQQWGFDLAGRTVEWQDGEAYVALPRPGGDGWIAFDAGGGMAEYELTDRGWVAWLNDLHKGRDTGTAWSWFIDVFSVAAIIFSLTGLVLLWLHSRHRRLTWPLVGGGLVLPLFIIVVFVHN